MAVTTVFFGDLPSDMTDREFHNIFQFADGFEEASLTPSPKGRGWMGFARFATVHQAEACIAWLSTRMVDPAAGLPFRCSLAQKNLKAPAKRPLEPEEGFYPHPHPHRPHAPPAPKLPRPDAPITAQDLYQTLAAFGLTQPMAPMPHPTAAATSRRLVHPPAGPNDTLHLRGLPADATPEELHQYCLQFEGYRDHRLVPGAVTAFALVQFHTPALAALALSQVPLFPFRGATLGASPARSPLNVPKR
jgi:hypothetical protein